MDWNDYEEITKHIYETLGSNSGVSIICHGRNCKVKGKSEVEHQVDVLTQHSDGLHTYKTAIECKYVNHNINKDIIMKVADIVEDAGLNKGVIVSKYGFTSDAIGYAKYRNVGLVELREMEEKDWKGRIQNIVIESIMLLPKITGLQFITDKQTSSDIPKGEIQIELIEIRKETGEFHKLKEYIDDFYKELLGKKENEIFEKVYKFNIGTVAIYKPTLQETLINGIKLIGELHKSKPQKIEIKGKDYVWLFMHSIFEDKTYTITKDKQIRERK